MSLWKLMKADKLGNISKKENRVQIIKTMKIPVNIERKYENN